MIGSGIRTKILAIAAVVLAAVVLLGLATYLAVDRQTEAARRVRASLDALLLVRGLETDLATTEAALLAGDPAAAASVGRTPDRALGRIGALRSLVGDDPQQVGRLDRLDREAREWRDAVATRLADAGQDPGLTARARERLDALRAQVAGLGEREARRLDARTREREAAERATRWILLAGGAVVAVGTAGAAALLASRAIRPLLALSAAVGRLAAGHPGRSTASKTGDEAEWLGAAFDRMVTEATERQETIDRARREAETVVEIQRDLAETLELVPLLQKIARHARLLTRSDLVYIAPFDPRAGVARVVAMLGERTAALRHLRIAPGRGLAGRALQTRRPCRTDNYGEDPQFRDSVTDPVTAEGVTANLAVPIVLEQELLGLIYVANRSTTAFTEHDEAVLQRLAVPAALAIRNARLVSELAQERDLQTVRSRERARSEAQLRGIVHAATDGIMTVDRQGRITSVNRAAQLMFGYAAQELLARELVRIVPEPAEAPAESEAALGQRTTGTQRRELEGVRQDGSRFPLEMSVSVVKTEHDHFFAVVVRDITDRKRAYEMRFQLASIVESSDDAIIGWTTDLAIASWNPGAERLYGYVAAEVIGKPFTLLVPPDRREEVGRFVQQLVRGEHLANHETARVTKDGRLIDVSLTISATRDENGRITGYSTIARDITERKAIERLKDEFIATVSHELRTPLTAIKGHLELVLDGEAGPVTEVARQFLDIASQNTDRLGALINDLLDVEKLEAGKMRLRRDPVDVAALLREVAATFRLEAERKGLAFRTEIPDRLVTAGDRDRLIQVFANLVSNAIKYTARGEIGIRAGRVDDRLEVVVHDTGVGMSLDDQQHLFTRFFRSADPAVRDAGGTGLGLVIARAIVDRHGGSITVESQKGQGTRLRVVLP